jgi:hypothetical protein
MPTKIVTRYSITAVAEDDGYHDPGASLEELPDPDGEWVRYSDVADEIERLQQQLYAVQRFSELASIPSAPNVSKSWYCGVHAAILSVGQKCPMCCAVEPTDNV